MATPPSFPNLTCLQEELQSCAALQLHLLVHRERLHGLHRQAEHVFALVLQQQQGDGV